VRALRILHRAFRGYPPKHRIHILIRYLTCPFLRTLDVIPEGSRVLEIGAGHGVYALLIATERAREVIAVDPDLRKMLLPSPSPRIRKVGGFENCIRGTFNAIVFYDTLYLFEVPDRPALFASLFERLKPGGTLVLKDMDPSDRLKTWWAKTQEDLNTRFLHITTGSGFVHQRKEELAALLEAAGFVDFHARSVGRGYPHPHILYTARRP
jgi:SAM-dependent methyltransferase